MKILVTGGAGFIGSAVVRHLLEKTEHQVVNVDKLTYAGNLQSIPSAESYPERYSFHQIDICDASAVSELFMVEQPEIVMHLAAESHVDRSIDGAGVFVQTNVVGTYTLLEAARAYWASLDELKRSAFRFHHISTDEVYGDLSATDPAFTEENPYEPSSPYSATKAASDHLVRAWGRTYGLPVLLTNCSNNYGPYHFPEKLIPLVILNALAGKPLPVYGDGSQIRDWLYVTDHAEALVEVATGGLVSETYNIGGHNEKTNIQVVESICSLLNELSPAANGRNYLDQIEFVTDRPGHDARYAIDATKIERELGWVPKETFESGLRKTVEWYLQNQAWCQSVLDGSYALERIGKI